MPTPSQVAPVTGGAQAPGAPRTTSFRLASPTSAMVLGGLTVILVAAVLVLSSLTHDSQDGLGANVPWVVIAVVFAAVGFVVARRQPHNSVGWILLAIGLSLLLSGVGTTYSVIDYRLHHGTLPLGLGAVFLGLLWGDAIVLTPLLVLLFPTGQVPSLRWRWTLWLYLIVYGIFVIASMVVAASTRIDISPSGNPNYNQLTGGIATLNNDSFFLAIIILALWLTWMVRLVASYRHTRGDSRQQLKWLMGGAMVTVIAFVALLSFSVLVPNGASAGIGFVMVYILTTFAIAALRVALGVGILKYRLYDVDRLISRTLSYAIVTGLLIGVYVGLVTLATRVLPFSSPLGVAVSTLSAFALFRPFHRRVQRLVDLRFNRARYDAEATVSAFAHRVRDDVDLEAVSSEFVRAVQSSVEPAHVSLWLRPTGSGS